jgi:hypothetical protein
MSPLLCSFCDKTQNEVKRLIAGPRAYICNECVDLCRQIIETDLESTVPCTVLGPSPDDTTPSPSAIRLPVQLVEKANRIARAERRLVCELGREPTAAEIAGATDFESDEVESIKARIAELTQP